MFSNDPHFHLQNFNACIDLVQYVAQLYQQGLTTPLSLTDIQSTLASMGLAWGTVFQTFASPFRSPQTPFGSVQTVMAAAGVIQGTRTAVIAFRGTSNNVEWINDFQSVRLQSIPSTSSSTNIGTVEPLSGVFLSMPSVLLGDGFYRIYASRIGVNASQGCVCKTDCENIKCRYYPSGDYTQIYQACQAAGPTTSCSTTNGSSAPSLQAQIYDYVTSMGCDRVLITGHSLGAALANVCAFHLQNALGDEAIHSVYALAPPRTGNPAFAQSLASLKDRYYTIINSNDLVPNVPLPFMPPGPGCFSHVGKLMVFNDVDTSLPCDMDYVWAMHRLSTYQKHGEELLKEYNR